MALPLSYDPPTLPPSAVPWATLLPWASPGDSLQSPDSPGRGWNCSPPLPSASSTLVRRAAVGSPSFPMILAVQFQPNRSPPRAAVSFPRRPGLPAAPQNHPGLSSPEPAHSRSQHQKCSRGWMPPWEFSQDCQALPAFHQAANGASRNSVSPWGPKSSPLRVLAATMPPPCRSSQVWSGQRRNPSHQGQR